MKELMFSYIRWAVAVGVGIAIGAFIFACGGAQQAVAPDMVRQYAECLADPAMPLHLPAGAEMDAAVHDAGLRAELAAGETTMAEIEAAFALWCKGE